MWRASEPSDLSGWGSFGFEAWGCRVLDACDFTLEKPINPELHSVSTDPKP